MATSKIVPPSSAQSTITATRPTHALNNAPTKRHAGNRPKLADVHLVLVHPNDHAHGDDADDCGRDCGHDRRDPERRAQAHGTAHQGMEDHDWPRSPRGRND